MSCALPLYHKYVMEWSGRCCRHSASHSGKWETTAGSVQQLQDFFFFFFCRPNQHKTSMNATDTRSQTYTVRAGRKESKQTVQSNLSSTQPNQLNLFPRSSATIDFATITQPIKSNNISNESLDNYLLNHVNKIYKSRHYFIINFFFKRVESMTRHGPERDSR